MRYNNIIPYYGQNMYSYRNRPFSYQNNPGNRPAGGFLLPFALGFVSSPLIFGATRPRPGYYYGPRPYPYYPYY